jgi:hypothetical protein
MAAPAALKPAVGTAPPAADKKGTAKVEITPPARPAPQATVKIAPAAPAAAPAAALKTAETAAAPTKAAEDSLTGLLAIAAAVVALAALGIQAWMFF